MTVIKPNLRCCFHFGFSKTRSLTVIYVQLLSFTMLHYWVVVSSQAFLNSYVFSVLHSVVAMNPSSSEAPVIPLYLHKQPVLQHYGLIPNIQKSYDPLHFNRTLQHKHVG